MSDGDLKGAVIWHVSDGGLEGAVIWPRDPAGGRC
jgi:hypothetical protein